MVMMLF